MMTNKIIEYNEIISNMKWRNTSDTIIRSMNIIAKYHENMKREDLVVLLVDKL